MEFTEELKDSIRLYLKDCEEIRVENTQIRAALAEYRENAKAKDEDLKMLNQKVKRFEDLNKREDDLQKREKELDLLKLELSKEKEMVEKLFYLLRMSYGDSGWKKPMTDKD